MYLASFANGLGAKGLQGFKVATIVYANACGQFFYRRKWAGPNNIVDIVIVGKNVVNTIVAIKHTYEVLALESKEIKKGAILTKPVGIVGIVA